MIWATVMCDASYKRVKHRHLGGWAAWVRIDGQAAPIKASGRFRVPITSSEEAEVYAALNGIWLASRAGAQAVLVRSDCMAVEHLIDGKRKPSRALQIWRDALTMPGMSGLVLRSRHVKAPGPIKCRGSYVNDWCDREAKGHMKQQEREYHGRFDRKGHRPGQPGAAD